MNTFKVLDKKKRSTLSIACIFLFTSVFSEIPKSVAADLENTPLSDTISIIKTITLTGEITFDGRIPDEGTVGIFQNSLIRDKLSVTGSFNLSFAYPDLSIMI